MKLIDIFKKKERPKKNYLGVVATSDFISGVLDTVPNPDVVLKRKGIGIEGYYDLLYDAHLSSVVQSRKAGVLSLEWDIDREQEPTPHSYFIESVLDLLDIKNLITEMLDAVLYGYKPLEIYWQERYEIKINDKYEKGNWLIPLSIVGKPPHWFEFDSLGGLVFNNMNLSSNGSVFPNKFIVVRHQYSSDNPYGKGVLSSCYWPVQFKKGTFAYWTKYAEKYGSPFLIGKIDETMSSYDSNTLQLMLDNIIAGGTGVIEKEMEIEVVNPTASVSSETFDKLINYLNQEMSKAVLSQTLTTEQGKVGSQALGTVHQEVRQEIVESDKDMIEKHINSFIRLLIDLNFGKQDKYPEFGLYEEYNPMTEIDNAVKLMNTGKVRFTENFYNRIGFSPDEYEIIKDNQDDNILPKPDNHTSDDSEEANTEFSENQNLIEKIKEELTEKYDNVNQKMFSDLINKIKNLNSFEEIEFLISNSFNELKESEITDIVESLIIASHFAGRESE